MVSAWNNKYISVQSVPPYPDVLVSLRKATGHPALAVFPAGSPHYIREVWPFSFVHPAPFLFFCPRFLACLSKLTPADRLMPVHLAYAQEAACSIRVSG